MTRRRSGAQEAWRLLDFLLWYKTATTVERVGAASATDSAFTTQPMRRALSFIYGIVSYLLFLAVFLYSIGFVGDFAVPRTVDAGGPEAAFWPALLINLGLLGLFALQHSGIARPGFKACWTRIIPDPIEHSTYVLVASAVLALLGWQWQPMPEVVWHVEAAWAQGTLWSLFGVGWLLVLTGTCLASSKSTSTCRATSCRHRHFRSGATTDTCAIHSISAS